MFLNWFYIYYYIFIFVDCNKKNFNDCNFFEFDLVLLGKINILSIKIF